MCLLSVSAEAQLRHDMRRCISHHGGVSSRGLTTGERSKGRQHTKHLYDTRSRHGGLIGLCLLPCNGQNMAHSTSRTRIFTQYEILLTGVYVVVRVRGRVTADSSIWSWRLFNLLFVASAGPSVSAQVCDVPRYSIHERPMVVVSGICGPGYLGWCLP